MGILLFGKSDGYLQQRLSTYVLHQDINIAPLQLSQYRPTQMMIRQSSST